jgi:hypothetical protein
VPAGNFGAPGTPAVPPLARIGTGNFLAGPQNWPFSLFFHPFPALIQVGTLQAVTDVSQVTQNNFKTNKPKTNNH